MCGSDGLSLSSSLLICGKSCRCQAENPLNALPSFARPALKLRNVKQTNPYPCHRISRVSAEGRSPLHYHHAHKSLCQRFAEIIWGLSKVSEAPGRPAESR